MKLCAALGLLTTDINRHSASRGPSAMAELLGIINVHVCEAQNKTSSVHWSTQEDESLSEFGKRSNSQRRNLEADHKEF